MIQRIRLLVLLARPAVLMLFGLFAATGLAQAGHANDAVLFAKALTAVIAFVLFAVAVNDIADARIDRVNLPQAANRPLAVGTARSSEMVVVAIVGAVLALGASTMLYWPAPAVVAGGLLLAAAYSLRPFRISHRGVLAPMLLPTGYVAVPYLVGILAARRHGDARRSRAPRRSLRGLHRPDRAQRLPRRARRRAVREAHVPRPARPTRDVRVRARASYSSASACCRSSAR